MSIFSKLNPLKLIKTIPKIVKKVAPIGKVVIDKVAPKEIKLVLSLAGKLKNLLRKKDSKMNEFEKAARTLVRTIDDFQDATGVDKALLLLPLLTSAKEISEALKGDPIELNPKVKQAFDNLIGDEENALIGTHPNAHIRVNTGFLPLEQLSDIMKDIAVDKLIPLAPPTPPEITDESGTE